MKSKVKQILASVILLFSAKGFAQQQTIKPTLLKPNTSFAASGTVTNEQLDLGSRIEINKVEKGDLNGVHYEIYYTDGSASFSGSENGQLAEAMSFGEGKDWSVSCKKDAMSDKKSCRLYRKDLSILQYSNGSLKVFVAGTDEHYPNTRVAIRVDSKEAIRSPSESDGFFTASQSQTIIRQLLSGSRVTTRYVNWPHGTNVDKSFELHGFKEAYKYLRWAVKQIK